MARWRNASVVIWTTTPWTLPGNRAISFSPKIAYGLFEVTDAPADNWAKNGDLLILADALAESVFKQARVTAYKKVRDAAGRHARRGRMRPSAEGLHGGYEFTVPLLPGDHVTDDTGTGFVHTAPGHGREDFDVWMANARELDSARHRHRDPLHRRRERRLHRPRAGLHRQARHQRQGREGRRQRSRDQGADRGRQAAWRAAASSISIRIPGARRSR